MLALVTLLGLLVTLVQTIRSGVTEVSAIATQIGDIFHTLPPLQRLAVAQLVGSTSDAGERAALEWVMAKGHGVTDTDEARELAGVVLAATKDAQPVE